MATNWTPFIPENTGDGEFGVDGIMRAASIVSLLIRFRGSLDAGQEAKTQTRHAFGIIVRWLSARHLHAGRSVMTCWCLMHVERA